MLYGNNFLAQSIPSGGSLAAMVEFGCSTYLASLNVSI